MKPIRLLLLTMMSLLILSTVFLLTSQPAKATAGITINSNGSITPNDGRITTADQTTYTFTADITDTIEIDRSNIILNGNMHKLQGPGSGDGISVSSPVNSVTIENVEIAGFDNGVLISSSSSYDSVSFNNIHDCYAGIRVLDMNNSTISNNVIDGMGYCIYLSSSGGYDVINNNTLHATTQSGGEGIFVDGNYVTVSNNYITT